MACIFKVSFNWNVLDYLTQVFQYSDFLFYEWIDILICFRYNAFGWTHYWVLFREKRTLFTMIRPTVPTRDLIQGSPTPPQPPHRDAKGGEGSEHVRANFSLPWGYSWPKRRLRKVLGFMLIFWCLGRKCACAYSYAFCMSAPTPPPIPHPYPSSLKNVCFSVEIFYLTA